MTTVRSFTVKSFVFCVLRSKNESVIIHSIETLADMDNNMGRFEGSLQEMANLH